MENTQTHTHTNTHTMTLTNIYIHIVAQRYEKSIINKSHRARRALFFNYCALKKLLCAVITSGQYNDYCAEPGRAV